MNTFYIARHGETENNVARRLSGWIDSPLTAQGLIPTAKVAEKLAHVPLDDIYSSDVGRAFITAYEIAYQLNFQKKIQRLPGLREVNYGDAANMQSSEAYERYPGLDSNTHFAPPNGESLSEMQKRVFQTLNELNSSHIDKQILLVCHSGVIAAIRAQHIGQDFGEHNISEAYPHDYAGMFTLGKDEVSSFAELL